MSGFPLYDNLVQQLPKKDLTVKQKEDFIKNISDIDNNGKELIYALVYIFYIQNLNKNCDDLPFDGYKQQYEQKKSHYNITWNFLNFPIKLRQLLYKFIILHMKTLHENVSRDIE